MAKIRFHKIAAVAVLIGFAAWMGTGKFSSVGSAAAGGETPPQGQAGASAPEAAKPAEAAPVLRTVAVVTPPRIQHARAIHVTGQTQADKRAILGARTGGVVKDLPISEGATVKAGDVIMALDPEDKPAMIAMTEQVVKQRQAELAAAKRLTQSGAAAKLQLDAAQSALAAAESQLEAAKADLARMTIYAPFDGVIDHTAVEIGSTVGQGGEVAILLSLNPVIVKGEISERDLGYVNIGDTADVTFVSGEHIKGAVRYIGREGVAATRTFRVEVAIDNPGNRLSSGLTTEITLRSAPVDAVVLPRSVVTLSNNGDLGIRAVDASGKVVFYPIDLVDDTQNGLALAGIPADAKVIVAGQDLVADGDMVNAVPADEAMVKKLIGEAAGTN